MPDGAVLGVDRVDGRGAKADEGHPGADGAEAALGPADGPAMDLPARPIFASALE
ncbi:hypothetical protein GCM10010195_45000 [Kitasatospora griseola]|nr:hypothetical protein GCM10010195_45000 [Kitasatospora griseola]